MNSSYPTDAPGYTAKLDEEQFKWLEEDLSKVPSDKPIMIFSHIPIVSVAEIPFEKQDEQGNLILHHRNVHADVKRLLKLFRKYPNIKGCQSGHTHLLDEVILNGIRYCNNGAVSGSWWKGSRDGVPPGYALLDLHADGTFDRQYVEYGWQPTAPDLDK